MSKAKTVEPAVTPDFLRELKALQAARDTAAQKYCAAKERAAELKKQMETEAAAIFAFIRNADGEAPLFDQEDEGE